MKQSPPAATGQTGPKKISLDKQIESFPPLPSTVAEVMQVTANPEASANDLMKAILPDQSMCLAVLKIANSVIYGRPKKVSSLERAIVVLGFDEVRNIVLGKAAVKSFQHICKTYQKELDGFWDHAFTCGLAARIVAEHLGLASGQFFMSGLLHDVGKLALLLAFGRRYQTEDLLFSFSSPEKLQHEGQTFSTNHALIGARLLQHWQFPDTLVSSLKHHHSPDQAPGRKGFPLIIQIADFLAHMYTMRAVLDEQALKTHLHTLLPGFTHLWHEQKLPWEDTTLEYWFAWLKVDREHGSSILDILAA